MAEVKHKLFHYYRKFKESCRYIYQYNTPAMSPQSSPWSRQSLKVSQISTEQQDKGTRAALSAEMSRQLK